ncbi:MAG: DUF3540 domain-containing protein, partial [Planctomycetota bacterium]
LALPGGEREAVLALATPYHPEVGDVVLVIGDEELYVIGVLSGRGTSRLAVKGDLELEATGAVRIAAGREVSMNAPDVAVKAGRLELTAERLLGRFVRAYEWIRETLKTSAGRIRTTTREGVVLRAERITAYGEKDVKINGRQIHLG